MLTLLALLMVVGLAVSALAPDARERLVDGVLTLVRRVRREATRSRPECDEFQAALRERTRWAPLTPVLIALNVAVFVLMAAGPGAVRDPETLANWGGNVWLSTRNGGWWRLVTSMFVHAGVLHLAVNLAGLAQIGPILERLVGRVTVTAVFLAAGILAGLVNLITHPMGTSVGASGAVFGLYGLLVASAVWGMRRDSSVTVPLTAATRLAPAAAVFILYNAFDGSLGGPAELTGLLTGLMCGAILTREVTERKPAGRRVAHVTAGSLAIAVVFAIPLRGVTDVKPELARTIAIEEQTMTMYREANERFRTGRMSAGAVASLIDQMIVPELQAAGDRLQALTGVPEEHRPLVADAGEYVRLRSESWRLRIEWLHTVGKPPVRGNEAEQFRSNRRTLAHAEDAQRAALEVLRQLRLVVER